MMKRHSIHKAVAAVLLADGTTISIAGKSVGSDVFGNNRWYELADGQGWAPAHYVDNYGYIPRIGY